MLYDYRNPVHLGTTVLDLDTRQRYRFIVSVDTDAGEVVRTPEPLRVVDGEIVKETIRFQAIWPIFDGDRPCAFHCHGRQN